MNTENQQSRQIVSREEYAFLWIQKGMLAFFSPCLLIVMGIAGFILWGGHDYWGAISLPYEAVTVLKIALPTASALYCACLYGRRRVVLRLTQCVPEPPPTGPNPVIIPTRHIR